MAEDQSLELPEETLNESTPEATGPGDAGALPPPTTPEPMTPERVLDTFLGAVAIAAEATAKRARELSEQASTLREDAPAILETWEERGRPLREQIVGKIKESFAPIPDEEPTPLPAPTAEEIDPQVATTIPAPPPVTTVTGRSAKREISALEQRVRELEAQVSTPPTSEPVVEFEAPAMTPAEEATFDPEQGHSPISGLAESEYAVSETDTESAHEEFEPSPFPKAEGE